jgi:hypothetical protein
MMNNKRLQQHLKFQDSRQKTICVSQLFTKLKLLSIQFLSVGIYGTKQSEFMRL